MENKAVVVESNKSMKTEEISLLQEKQKKILKDIPNFISLFRSGARELECSECVQKVTRKNVVDHCKKHIMEFDNKIAEISDILVNGEDSKTMIIIEVDPTETLDIKDNGEKEITNEIVNSIKSGQVNVKKIKVDDPADESDSSTSVVPA